jgi:hypothetical protein
VKVQEGSNAEDLANEIAAAAHHEAGHAVIAASIGIRLRKEGIMVGRDGKGLSCYCYQPSKGDGSIEASVITSYSGFIAENHFRRLAGLPERLPQVLEDSEDWGYARRFASNFADVYLAGRSLGRVQSDLKEQAILFVAANWPAIESLAQELLSRQWERKKALNSGGKWSDAEMAKYVLGDEIVTLLIPFGINAVCVKTC